MNRDIDPTVLHRHLGLPPGTFPDERVERDVARVADWYRQQSGEDLERLVRAAGSWLSRKVLK